MVTAAGGCTGEAVGPEPLTAPRIDEHLAAQALPAAAGVPA
jgi:hypothetical protein